MTFAASLIKSQLIVSVDGIFYTIITILRYRGCCYGRSSYLIRYLLIRRRHQAKEDGCGDAFV